MRTSLCACGTVVAGFALFQLTSDSAQAQAQSACVQQCRSGGWSYSQCTRYCTTTIAADASPTARSRGSTRVYGYYRRRGGSCGQYHYVKAGQCVDARVDAPALK
jgi:hypothetical protein